MITDILPDGTREWRNDRGELHREDGPAVLYQNGGYVWYRDGVMHREGGPAMAYPDGYRMWCLQGQVHREGGPAIESATSQSWYRHGRLHREDGPALVYTSGKIEYYLEGTKVDSQEFALIQQGKTWEQIYWRRLMDGDL